MPPLEPLEPEPPPVLGGVLEEPPLLLVGGALVEGALVEGATEVPDDELELELELVELEAVPSLPHSRNP